MKRTTGSQNSEYNKKTHRYREQTGGYTSQVEGQDWDRGLRRLKIQRLRII